MGDRLLARPADTRIEIRARNETFWRLCTCNCSLYRTSVRGFLATLCRAHCLKPLLLGLFGPSPEIVGIITFGGTGHVSVFRWTGFQTDFAVLRLWVGLLSGRGRSVAVPIGPPSYPVHLKADTQRVQ
jgi:hypothetical protein